MDEDVGATFSIFPSRNFARPRKSAGAHAADNDGGIFAHYRLHFRFQFLFALAAVVLF
jgi:hypothetical protein